MQPEDITRGWSNIVQMAVPTALGFLLFGSATVVLAWHDPPDQPHSTPTRLPIFVWHVLGAPEQAYFRLVIRAETGAGRGIRNELKPKLTGQIHVPQRMVRRWERTGTPSYVDWSVNDGEARLVHTIKAPIFDSTDKMDELLQVQAIKAKPAIAEACLPMMTSLGYRGDEPYIVEAGICADLTKPVKQSHLFEQIATQMCDGRGDVPGTTLTGAVSELSPEPSAASDLPVRMLGAGATRARILIAEDNLVNQQVVLRQLQKLGYTADAVGNGQEVLRCLQCLAYDLVLMDCQMPEMDWYETAAAIRQQEGTTRRVTIVAMIAHASQGDHDKCLAVGMDDYLSKPIKVEDLRVVLKHWLENPMRRDEQGPGIVPSPSNPPIDLTRLQEVTGGNKQEMLELVELYLEQAAHEIASLHAAIQAGAALEVERLAHRCAGASANCGMLAIVPPLRALEHAAQAGRLAAGMDFYAAVVDAFARIKTFWQASRVAV